MSFTVPVSWERLSQEQLRYVIRLLRLYGGAPDWQERVTAAAFLRFCDIEVAGRTDQGWLCRERGSGKTFLLDPALLPELLGHLGWVAQPDRMNVRIEKAGKYEAVDFELQELPFGKYLEAENWYQSFLLSPEENSLKELARILYLVPDGDEAPELCGEILTGAFLWFGAVKTMMAGWFPNFLKKAADGDGRPVTQESLIESANAQMRLLTKGDVTKDQYIRDEVKTWTAMAELDALAKEAEEIRRKYGK